MLFQIFKYLNSIYSMTSNENSQIINELKATAKLTNSPVQIQIHEKNPYTLTVGEQPKIIATMKPEKNNDLFFIYEADKSLIDLCAGKEIFAVILCPNLLEGLNYQIIFNPNWIIERIPIPIQQPAAQLRHPIIAESGEGEVVPPPEDNPIETNEESVTQYIVLKRTSSHKNIFFGIYLKPIFSIDDNNIITDPTTKQITNEITIKRSQPIPKETLEKTFIYKTNDGESKKIKFSYTYGYPNTDKITSEFLDISLETIHLLMLQGINIIKQSLIPVVKMVENMIIRERIQKTIIESKKKYCLDEKSTHLIDKIKSYCEYNFTSSISKYQISAFSAVVNNNTEYYSEAAFKHLQNTIKAIFSCSTQISINACIKAHLLYIWSLGYKIEMECMGLINSNFFFDLLNWDILNTTNEGDKEYLAKLGCQVKQNSQKLADTTNNKKDGEADLEEDTNETSDEEENTTTSPTKKGGNIILYVSIAVVVVCVTSVAVYYVVA